MEEHIFKDFGGESSPGMKTQGSGLKEQNSTVQSQEEEISQKITEELRSQERLE